MTNPDILPVAARPHSLYGILSVVLFGIAVVPATLLLPAVITVLNDTGPDPFIRHSFFLSAGGIRFPAAAVVCAAVVAALGGVLTGAAGLFSKRKRRTLAVAGCTGNFVLLLAGAIVLLLL